MGCVHCRVKSHNLDHLKPAVEPNQFSEARTRMETTLVQRNNLIVDQAMSFLPYVIQEAYHKGNLSADGLLVQKCSGALLFCDASGFTALTERLGRSPNGAELLTRCLNLFFTPLIEIITAYRGDIIKFSGDALTIFFRSVNDKPAFTPSDDMVEEPDEMAVLRACACCLEIHRKMHNFDTGEGVFLTLHIGVGFGDVSILQLGGVCPPNSNSGRFEYVIAGPPLEQISIAEPLAGPGETVVSPEAYRLVENLIVTGRPIPEHPGFQFLLGLDNKKHTYPTIKYTAKRLDKRSELKLRFGDLHVARRFIPPFVMKQIENGTMEFVNEIRWVSIVFVEVGGVDLGTDFGAQTAEELMSRIQQNIYRHEGNLNKFLVDDKGLLMLNVFGLPPMVHTDDAARAVRATFDMVETLTDMKLRGRFGIVTGRVFCGVVGSKVRQEYTVMGDNVNLAARLMANSQHNSILTDRNTAHFSKDDIEFQKLESIKVKGKEDLIEIFRPLQRTSEQIAQVRFSADKLVVNLPWLPTDQLVGGSSPYSMIRENEAKLYVDCLLEKKNTEPDCYQGDPTLYVHGGSLHLLGKSGCGKLELLEYLAAQSVMQYNVIPIFATMQGRPGEGFHGVVEILMSLVHAFRTQVAGYQDLPTNNVEEALNIILADKPSAAKVSSEAVRKLMLKEGSPTPNNSEYSFKGRPGNPAKLRTRRQPAPQTSFTDVDTELYEDLQCTVEELIDVFVEVSERTLLLMFRVEHGTCQHLELINFDLLWTLVERINTKVMGLRTRHKKMNTDRPPYAVLVVVAAAIRNVTDVSVDYSKYHSWFYETHELTQSQLVEYCSLILGVPSLPTSLQVFLTDLTGGNPKFARELLSELIAAKIIDWRNAQLIIDSQALDAIDISQWGHTSMVGETVCLLESLNPQSAMVLKMGSCFQGSFTVADLGSAHPHTCHWNRALLVNFVRLWRTCHNLVKQKILMIVVEADQLVGGRGKKKMVTPSSFFHRFKFANMLMQRVAASMLLQTQKLIVKRQALMQRVISRELPVRLEWKDIFRKSTRDNQSINTEDTANSRGGRPTILRSSVPLARK